MTTYTVRVYLKGKIFLETFEHMSAVIVTKHHVLKVCGQDFEHGYAADMWESYEKIREEE